jgi:hypothetical protein
MDAWMDGWMDGWMRSAQVNSEEEPPRESGDGFGDFGCTGWRFTRMYIIWTFAF